MANVPRPDGPWVDGADSITAAEANRWEANQQDASDRHDALRRVLAGNPDLLIAGAITRDGNGAATAAPVVWPDGRPGQYTATTVSTAFPGAVDAYTITYDGTDADLTYTQLAVTRDASGAVTARPAVTVT